LEKRRAPLTPPMVQPTKRRDELAIRDGFGSKSRNSKPF
jgi:hypothetical protein